MSALVLLSDEPESFPIWPQVRRAILTVAPVPTPADARLRFVGRGDDSRDHCEGESE